MPSPTSPTTLDIRATPAAVTSAAAERVVSAAAAAIDDHGRFVIALSGGSTPRALFALLATPAYAGRIDWSRAQIFWGDERCVPPDDPASNYRMAREALLSLVPVPPEHIHRIAGETEPRTAAAEYERELRAVFPGESRPRFDLILLGLGDDGHTASLFPGLGAAKETTHWVVAEYVAKVRMWRVTLTAPAINAAAAVLFLVVGADKASALRQVVEGPREPDRFPAQLVAPDDGHVTWLVDAAAARLLLKASSEH